MIPPKKAWFKSFVTVFNNRVFVFCAMFCLLILIFLTTPLYKYSKPISIDTFSEPAIRYKTDVETSGFPHGDRPVPVNTEGTMTYEGFLNILSPKDRRILLDSLDLLAVQSGVNYEADHKLDVSDIERFQFSIKDGKVQGNITGRFYGNFARLEFINVSAGYCCRDSTHDPRHSARTKEEMGKKIATFHCKNNWGLCPH